MDRVLRPAAWPPFNMITADPNKASTPMSVPQNLQSLESIKQFATSCLNRCDSALHNPRGGELQRFITHCENNFQITTSLFMSHYSLSTSALSCPLGMLLRSLLILLNSKGHKFNFNCRLEIQIHPFYRFHFIDPASYIIGDPRWLHWLHGAFLSGYLFLPW